MTVFFMSKDVPQRVSDTLSLAQQESDIQTTLARLEKAALRSGASVQCVCHFGVALAQVNRVQEAIQVLQTAIDKDPEYPDSYTNLSNIYLSLGQFGKAEDCAQQALSRNPNNVDAMVNLGAAFMNQGKTVEGIKTWEAAYEIDKTRLVLVANLSKAYMNMAQFQKAEVLLCQAIQNFPDHIGLRLSLINVLFACEKYTDAELHLHVIEGQDLSPSDMLGMSLAWEKLHYIDKAIKCLQKVIDQDPQNAQAYIRLGQIYHLMLDVDQAAQNYLQAKECDPNIDTVYICLAELAQTQGDRKQALQWIHQALDINPKSSGAHMLLSKIKKFKHRDGDVEMMHRLEGEYAAKDPIVCGEFNFALYKAYDDMCEYDQAFHHLKQANDIVDQRIPDITHTQDGLYQRIKDGFQAYKGHDFSGYETDVPVFIVGMPRSGTTLVEQVLAAHPDIHPGGELDLFGQAQRHVGGSIRPDNAQHAGLYYTQALRKIDAHARYITNKMPANFLNIGQILRCLPSAKIIHCRRDPIETCFSCYKQNFLRGHYWAYDLEKLVLEYSLYEDMVQFWQHECPGQMHHVSYEDMVLNTEDTVKDLLEYLGLPWHDACLSPERVERPVATSSKMQVRRPIYRSSLKAAENYKRHLAPLYRHFSVEG